MTRERKRRGKTHSRSIAGIQQKPWIQARNHLPSVEVLSTDQIEDIHQASLKILRDLGMVFLDDDALQVLKKNGAHVGQSSQLVKFPPELVEEFVAKAPEQFKLHARNPAHSLEIGGNWISHSMGSSMPNASDLDGGRRAGNFKDFEDLVRLSQYFNAIHLNGGYPVEPVDLPPATRHLDCVHSLLTLTDKPPAAYALGRQRISDAIDMVCIAHGKRREELRKFSALISTINTNSPLQIDGPMLQGLLELARNGQCSCITPFTLSGAMAPVTLAGALAQQNAEALAAIAFAQMVAPGSPVIYGGFTSNVDMKSGAPAFGTPEYAQTVLAGAQLARRYKIPYRSSNVNACNTVDAQSGYESMMSLWPAVLGHTNLIKHCAGWLEGGLCISFEKVVVDVELLQMMTQFLNPMQVNQSELAYEAIEDVGHGGHFFGAEHTLARYENAFYPPILSDWSNFGQWTENGSLDTAQRANRIWKQALADYQPPPLDQSRREELSAFVMKRKENPGIDV